MPSDARGTDLLSTPSSPRPSSSASSSTSSSSAHLPLRTTSMDSIPTAAGEKVEHIPTRTVATGPKVNTKAMIFVKTGPAQLYKSAAEQMKKAQTVKDMRRLAVQEEEPEWQQNLESWKKSRRKRNEDALERVIEVKKAENEKNRRMSSGSIGLGGKTGRRLNVVVHDDDDNNDLSDLGLSRGTSYPGVLTDTSNTDIVTSIGKQSKLNSTGASSTTTTTILDSPPSSLMIMTGHHSAKTSSANSAIPATTTAAINNKNRTTTSAIPFKSMAPLAAGFTTTTHTTSKYLLDNDNNSTDNVNDNKDAKSDAGFCTGSDTGSDGLFPDDNISDTSSALGDKKEAHDSLLDAVVLLSKDDEVMTHTTASSITSCMSSSITCSSLTKQETMEYTYDKAIEGYKQYAENSIKKRTSSMTSLNSISSGCVRYDKESSLSAVGSPKGPGKIGDKLDFFVKEMDKEFTKPDPKPLVIMREKSPKVDITKRRTMFEMGHSVSTVNLCSVEPKLEKRKSSDMTASTGNLKSKVASFESFEIDKGKQQGIILPRDTKFKEKLANFSTKPSSNESAQLRKKVPEKDKNFHQKLASFTSLENADESKSMVRKTSLPQLNTASLKSKIASFEQLDQQDNSTDFHLGDGNQNQTREKSISMECLTRYSASRRHEVNGDGVYLRKTSSGTQSSSAGCLATSVLYPTPYIEVYLPLSDEPNATTRSLAGETGFDETRNKRKTVYETVDICQIVRNVSSAPMYSIFCNEDSNEQRDEAKLNRGSVEALDEEGPELSRKDHNWRPPRASRSPEKSKFSSKMYSFDETYSSSSKITPVSERRSQLHKSSSESKDEDFKFRSEKQVDTNKIRDGAPSTVSRILPSTKFVGQESSVLCPPLDLSSPQSEAPISTSSPRQDSSLSNTTFPQSTATKTSKSLTTESLRSENKNDSSSPSRVVTSFSSSVASVISSSSTKVDKSDSVVRYSQEDYYDDVVNTVESSSLRSSMESDRPHYTDDDINEVIDDLGSHVKPEVASKGVRPPAKSAPHPRRILPTVPMPSSAPPPATVDVQPAPVVIVDWSESGGPVAPPSEAPPPPPPDDDDNDSEAPQMSSSPPPPPSSSTGTSGPVSHGYYPSFEVPATSPTPSDCPSLVPSETYASSEGSRTSAKEQLRQRRSDFLGTSHVAAEPPLDALLQQQRAADRQMLETRRSLQLSTHQVLSDIDQSSSYRSQMLKSSMSVDAGKSVSRDRYTWEDRLRDDITQPNAGLNDTDDGYGYHNKLEELEAEMLRHDRAVLSRTRSQQAGTTGRVPDSVATGTQQPGTAGTTSNGDNMMDSSSSARAASPTYDDVTVQSAEPAMYDNSNTAATTTVTAGTATRGTEQQRDDSYYEDNIVQQQQNHYNKQNTQQSPLQHHKPHQQQREQHQELQSLSYQPPVLGPEKPLRTYNSCYDSTAPVSAPEVLLRKKMPASPPEEDNYEAVDPGQGQHMSKQSRQALSATPRTRLQQGESWIMRKTEQTRDYNKHWLIQEAEQRRLEQRDRRISKGEARHDAATTTTSTTSSSSTSPHTLTSASSLTKLAPSPYHKPQHSTQLSHSNMNTNATRTDFRSSETSVTNRTSSSSSDLSLNKALDPYSTSGSTSAPPPPAGTRPQEPVNRTTDPNAWRNQATTYQPLPTPAPSNGWDSKPLPDSIISTLTARVQNRSRPGSANSSSGRPSPYSGSMGGSSSNLHYAANYPATTNGNAYTTDENYHDYMNTDAINLQRQQQYQYQEQQQQQIINSENQQQQQPLYANYSMKTNTGSSASINTDHYVQHHQTSPTTSLPLSSSSSSVSALQQQQQYHSHHHSPHPSPTQTNNLVTNRNTNTTTNNNNNHSSSKTSPMSSSSSSVASSSKPKDQRLSVSGNKKCCHCGEELGRGAAMIIESLKLFYHIPCFVCCVCGLQLGNGESGADVRVRNHALHCHNCYSNDQGMKFSEV